MIGGSRGGDSLKVHWERVRHLWITRAKAGWSGLSQAIIIGFKFASQPILESDQHQQPQTCEKRCVKCTYAANVACLGLETTWMVWADVKRHDPGCHATSLMYAGAQMCWYLHFRYCKYLTVGWSKPVGSTLNSMDPNVFLRGNSCHDKWINWVSICKYLSISIWLVLFNSFLFGINNLETGSNGLKPPARFEQNVTKIFVEDLLFSLSGSASCIIRMHSATRRNRGSR